MKFSNQELQSEIYSQTTEDQVTSFNQLLKLIMDPKLIVQQYKMAFITWNDFGKSCLELPLFHGLRNDFSPVISG